MTWVLDLLGKKTLSLSPKTTIQDMKNVPLRLSLYKEGNLRSPLNGDLGNVIFKILISPWAGNNYSDDELLQK